MNTKKNFCTMWIDYLRDIIAVYCTCTYTFHIHRAFVVGAVRLLRVDLKCTRCHGNAYQSAVCPPTTICCSPPLGAFNSRTREMKLKAENKI